MNQVRLKVCSPVGKVVIANTELKNGVVLFEVPYLEVVEKDKPPFAKKGIISFSCPQPRYQKSKKMITKYLEDLFLKELANATIYPGNGGNRNTGGIKKESSSGDNGSPSGKNNNPVRDRGGRREQPESDRDGIKKIDLAKSGDQENDRGSQEGN